MAGTRAEAAAVPTGDELGVAAGGYDSSTAGEMHHNPAKNVLFVAETMPVLAARLKLSELEAQELLRSAEDKLRAERARRTAPFVDRTQYASWNAMLAGALLRAGVVLEDEWALAHALRTLERIRAENPEPDTVAHTPGGVGGLLDDQVQVAQASLEAYEATGDESWLAWSESLMERVWRDYWDAATGGLFDAATSTVGGGEGLLRRSLGGGVWRASLAGVLWLAPALLLLPGWRLSVNSGEKLTAWRAGSTGGMWLCRRYGV